jgi:Ni/Fe-hydrogenase subunit HybB-like protein
MKLKIRKLTPWMVWVTCLAGVISIGVVAGLLVFWKGLSLTNLTDRVPWGLWITIDLSSIAMSAGAFSLCAVVYLLGLKRYMPVARTATFIGLIGYTMAVLTLLLDIGRPDRFWHSMIFWNKHSVLWEVTMCVTLYLAVLALESMPIFAGFGWLRTRWPKLTEKMSGITIRALPGDCGLALSMLHQSFWARSWCPEILTLWYRRIYPSCSSPPLLVVWRDCLLRCSRCQTQKANVNNAILDRFQISLVEF